jgi:hypothetical protein
MECGSGRIISESDWWEAIRAQLTPHVVDVIRRVEIVMGDEQTRFWPVKLAALLHEMSIAEVEEALRQMGFRDVARLVCEIIEGFGHIWKINDESQLCEYVFLRQSHLEPLLLFEVAHDGAATDAMRAAARLGGYEENLEIWVGRLASVQRSSSNIEFVEEGRE